MLRDLSYEEVAQVLGQGVAAVRSHEWSQANLRWSTLRSHLDALGCTLHDLADEVEPELASAGRHRRQLGEALSILEGLSRELSLRSCAPEGNESPPGASPASRVTKYIGPVLTRLRERQDLTMAEVANRLGKVEMTVRSYEIPSSNPRWETLDAYLDALGCSLHDLAEEAEPILEIGSSREVEEAAHLLRSVLRRMDVHQA